MPFYKLILLLFSLSLVVPTATAQNSAILRWKAGRQYNQRKFEEAVKTYKTVLDKDSADFKANTKLGLMYLYNFELYDSAQKYLDRAWTDKKGDTVLSHLYHYGHCLRLQERPDEALTYFQRFKDIIIKHPYENDSLTQENVDMQMNYARVAEQRQEAASQKIEVNNAGFFINSIQSEYTPVYIEEDSTLVYNARYKDSRKEKTFYDDQYMENIYYFDFDESVSSVYDQSLDAEEHFAVVSKNEAKNEFVIYHKNKLWFSKMENGKIQKPQPFPRNLTNFYFQPHGFFSVTSDSLIFSAQKTAQDQLDLYMSTKNADGTWTDPQLLSSTINSPFNEDSPLLSRDGKTLYFSSKGHNSSGGYDIFKSTYEDGNWSTPTPLPYPINSAGDDIYLDLSENEKYGYLASNRDDGFGLMDIYMVDFDPLPVFDCDTFPNPLLAVDFDLTESMDTNSVPLKYTWFFEDGETFEGPAIKKVFKTPGEHLVKINILDIEAGKEEVDEVIEIVNLEGIDFVGYAAPEKVRTTDTAQFDGAVSHLDNHLIVDYDWKVDETILSDHNPVLNYQFEQPGMHEVVMQLNVVDEEERYKSYCYVQEIEVIEVDENDADSTDTSPSATDVFNSDSLLTNNNNAGNNSGGNGDNSNNGGNNGNNNDNNGNNGDNFSNEQDVYDIINSNDLDTSRFNPIYFGFDKIALKQQSIADLNKLVDYMAANPDVLILIEGHTDAMGSSRYNQILAKRRANAAYNYLLKKGVNKKRILKIVSHGESQPAEPNVKPDGSDNSLGRSKNRRVEFIIVY